MNIFCSLRKYHQVLLKLIILFIYFGLVCTKIQAQNKTIISTKINDPLALESSPNISFDGMSLIYMSNKSGKWRLYESHINDESSKQWGEPVMIEFKDVELNETITLRDPAYNHDAKGIYFSADFPDTKGALDLYFAQKLNGIWQKPINLGSKINSEFSERSPSITSDENYIYFTRKNLKSENDDISCSRIFFSKKIDNEWSNPMPLPSPINIDCENYPNIAPDNKTLYFSSQREGGIGGYDIYMSKMLAENIWLLPVNISAINTTMDELDPSYSVIGNQLVFGLSLSDKKSTIADIYAAGVTNEFMPDETFIYRGKIADILTNEPLQANILIRNKENLKLISTFTSEETTGNYTIVFAKWINYEIEVYKNNYSHYFFNVNTKDYKNINSNTIKNIFLFNKSKLILNTFDEELFEPLQSVVKITKDDGSEYDNEFINYIAPGRIEIELDIGYKYNFLVQKNNFEDYSFSFDLTDIVQFDEFEKDIELKPKKSEFEINIADIETDETIDEVEIIITNLEKNETIVKKVRRDENGKFVVDLRDGDKYEINVNGPKGYAFYNTKVDMADDNANKKLDVKLQALTAKTKLVLNDITFETNSAELNKSSYEELNRVVKLLLDNPEIKIEISAHTDNIGSANYNQKLSDKRAQSVVNYLIDNNLPTERFIAKGYGETNPVIDNNSEENRAKNRRVELKIID